MGFITVISGVLFFFPKSYENGFVVRVSFSAHTKCYQLAILVCVFGVFI